MKRFVLPEPPGPEGVIRLYEKDFRYLARVRRLKAGDCFEAALPGGVETRVRILSTAGNTLVGECLESPGTQKGPSPTPPLALFQSLPKGAKMDLIVRQAAEGGVSVVAPFASEHSAVKLAKSRAGGESAEKLKRWERIVKEARQQSGSVTETAVRPPCDFDALLEYWESLKKEYRRPLGLVCHQDLLEKGSFHGYLDKDPDFVALAVGPEGGFSPKETALFMAAGFKPLLMGNTVLRTETAALYGTAAIRIILLERESWTLKPAPSPDP